MYYNLLPQRMPKVLYYIQYKGYNHILEWKNSNY